MCNRLATTTYQLKHEGFAERGEEELVELHSNKPQRSRLGVLKAAFSSAVTSYSFADVAVYVYLYLTVPNSWASPGMIGFYYMSINKRHIPCFIVTKGGPVTTLNEPVFQRQTWHICISFFPCSFFLDLEGVGEKPL